MTTKGKVRQRRTRFIKEYLKDQNATRAARAAGFSERSAYSQGHRLLKNDEVARAISEENAKINAKLDLTVERVRHEIARVAYLDPRNFFNQDGTLKQITELDEDAARGLAGFEAAELFEGSGEERAAVGYIKKFKFTDKVRALELASRHLGALHDKVEVTDTDLILQRLAAGRERIARS